MCQDTSVYHHCLLVGLVKFGRVSTGREIMYFFFSSFSDSLFMASRLLVLSYSLVGSYVYTWNDNQVTIKIIRTELMPSVEDLSRLYDITKKKLAHGNIAAFKSVQAIDAGVAVVCEFVDGVELGDFIAAKGRLTESGTLYIAFPGWLGSYFMFIAFLCDLQRNQRHVWLSIKSWRESRIVMQKFSPTAI